MDPIVSTAILCQYRASLAMLRQAVAVCPEAVWLGPDRTNRFWHIAYHSLFFTHLYLYPTEADFHPWARHQPDSQHLGPRPGVPRSEPKPVSPYTKDDVLEYWDLCRAEVEARVPALDLEAPSGFHWLPFNKLELQFYNIRHIQHHTGQLADRLRSIANIGLPWVRTES